MMYVVTGGSGSGKSAYAEAIVQDISCGERVYLATMKVYGEEGQAKVQRHIELRAQKGFFTIEKIQSIGDIVPDIAGRRVTLLLEDLPNLLANELYDDVGHQSDTAKTIDKIYADVSAVYGACENMVIVTGEVFSDGNSYDKSTMDYIHALGRLNCLFAERADSVVEVVCGIPLIVKEKND